MEYAHLITLEPDKRSGQACIRGLRMTVRDVLEYLAAGMTPQEVVDEFPDLTLEDIRACLAYAADRERRLWVVPVASNFCLTKACPPNCPAYWRLSFPALPTFESSVWLAPPTRSFGRTLPLKDLSSRRKMLTFSSGPSCAATRPKSYGYAWATA